MNNIDEIPKPKVANIPRRYGKDGRPLRCPQSEQLQLQNDRDWHRFWLTKKLR